MANKIATLLVRGAIRPVKRASAETYDKLCEDLHRIFLEQTENLGDLANEICREVDEAVFEGAVFAFRPRNGTALSDGRSESAPSLLNPRVGQEIAMRRQHVAALTVRKAIQNLRSAQPYNVEKIRGEAELALATHLDNMGDLADTVSQEFEEAVALVEQRCGGAVAVRPENAAALLVRKAIQHLQCATSANVLTLHKQAEQAMIDQFEAMGDLGFKVADELHAAVDELGDIMEGAKKSSVLDMLQTRKQAQDIAKQQYLAATGVRKAIHRFRGAAVENAALLYDEAEEALNDQFDSMGDLAHKVAAELNDALALSSDNIVLALSERDAGQRHQRQQQQHPQVADSKRKREGFQEPRKCPKSDDGTSRNHLAAAAVRKAIQQLKLAAPLKSGQLCVDVELALADNFQDLGHLTEQVSQEVDAAVTQAYALVARQQDRMESDLVATLDLHEGLHAPANDSKSTLLPRDLKIPPWLAKGMKDLTGSSSGALSMDEDDGAWGPSAAGPAPALTESREEDSDSWGPSAHIAKSSKKFGITSQIPAWLAQGMGEQTESWGSEHIEQVDDGAWGPAASDPLVTDLAETSVNLDIDENGEAWGPLAEMASCPPGTSVTEPVTEVVAPARQPQIPAWLAKGMGMQPDSVGISDANNDDSWGPITREPAFDLPEIGIDSGAWGPSLQSTARSRGRHVAPPWRPQVLHPPETGARSTDYGDHEAWGPSAESFPSWTRQPSARQQQSPSWSAPREPLRQAGSISSSTGKSAAMKQSPPWWTKGMGMQPGPTGTSHLDIDDEAWGPDAIESASDLARFAAPLGADSRQPWELDQDDVAWGPSAASATEHVPRQPQIPRWLASRMSAKMKSAVDQDDESWGPDASAPAPAGLASSADDHEWGPSAPAAAPATGLAVVTQAREQKLPPWLARGMGLSANDVVGGKPVTAGAAVAKVHEIQYAALLARATATALAGQTVFPVWH